MPDWMKSLQRDQVPFSGETGTSAATPVSPSRLSQGSSPIPQIPASPPQRSAGGSAFDLQSLSSPTTPPVTSGQSGFSARDLIDPQSLPPWMAQQGERPAQPTQPAPSSQSGALRTP